MMSEYGWNHEWIPAHVTPAQLELFAGAITRRQQMSACRGATIMRMAQHARDRDFKRFLAALRPDDAPERVRNMTIEQWAALGLKVKMRNASR